MISNTCSQGSRAHLIGVCLLPVVFKQVLHAHLVAFVIGPVALTIQVQSVLIQPTVVHNTEGNVHLHSHIYSDINGPRPARIDMQRLRTSVLQDSELEL